MKWLKQWWFWGLLALSALAVAFAPLPSPAPSGQVKTLRLEAGQFAYRPAELRVNVGDTVVLQLVSTDVVHGVYVDGYGVSATAEPGQTATLTFTADRVGTFRLRCNVTCGALHPFMIGKITVGRNDALYRALGLLVLVGLALVSTRSTNFRSVPAVRNFDLTRFPFLKTLLKSRYPQWVLSLILLGGYLFAIVSGFVSTPVGNHNVAIVFVWILWWALLILLAVPFLGRCWCSVCPIPLPGEWIQRGSFLEPPSQQPRWLNRPWPKALRNIWLQNASFTLLALFSGVLLTTPHVTALVLAILLFLATGLSLIFERRAFCRYLCPVGGFIGLYAQGAPIELRVREKQICTTCREKPCYNGSVNGYGCPWNVFPGGLSKNTYCGLCLECLRTCPHENIALRLRPFGADLSGTLPRPRLDEAFKAFLMIGAALFYAATWLGPWGGLKEAAYAIGSTAWAIYLLAFLGFTFLLLPLLFSLTLMRRPFHLPQAKTLAHFSLALIPLGLAFWIAFSLSFVLTNFSYVLTTLSDPFALGWNLFGSAHSGWSPFFPSLLPALQIAVLLGGFLWSARTLYTLADQETSRPYPALAYNAALTSLMLWLLL
ncbi:MAG: 4Fe-4S binding protein [Anaerolineales bacterium]